MTRWGLSQKRLSVCTTHYTVKNENGIKNSYNNKSEVVSKELFLMRFY